MTDRPRRRPAPPPGPSADRRRRQPASEAQRGPGTSAPARASTGRRRGAAAEEGRPAVTPAPGPLAVGLPSGGDDLDAAILRYIRRFPNQARDLAPLAQELNADPYVLQLAVERLHRRRLVVAPFIEPGRAGGAELTEKGLRWLIEREGGKPSDVPVALRPATGRVRAADEAARLPRSQVYGRRDR